MLIRAVAPTTVIFVRHAQTTWNKEQRHSGTTDVPLSPAAARQIGIISRRLLQEPIEAIYSSPLQRCRKTVEVIAEVTGIEPHINLDLKERSLGTWEGKSAKELFAAHPAYQFPISAYDGTFHIPEAETLDHLEKRIRHFLRHVHRLYPGKTVLASSHSGVMWTILRRIVANPPADIAWPANCAVISLEIHRNNYSLLKVEEGFQA